MIILIDAKETFNNTQHKFLKPVLSFRPRVGPFSVNDCLKSQLAPTHRHHDAKFSLASR